MRPFAIKARSKHEAARRIAVKAATYGITLVSSGLWKAEATSGPKPSSRAAATAPRAVVNTRACDSQSRFFVGSRGTK